jgi:hypothetical protein
MSRTIKAIMRHMVPRPTRSGGPNVSVQLTTAEVLRPKPERKLRVVFAPPPFKPVA